jgi:signal transduction histidine kinase
VISSLRVRMMVAVGLLAVTAVIAVAFAARLGTRHEFRRFQEMERIATRHAADDAPDRVTSLLNGRCCSPDVVREAAAALAADQVLIILDDAGSVIAKAGQPLGSLNNLRVTRHGEVLTVDAVRREQGNAMTSVGLRFRLPGIPLRTSAGATAMAFVIPIPEPETQRPEAVFLGSIDRSLLLATILVAVIALLVTWTLTRRIARPIDELRAAAADIARGNLARRVDTSGSDEVAQLVRDFNAMATDLERQQELRRNLVHDVVHELRTPLTALRCRLDAVSDGVARDPRHEIAAANEEIDHLASMVEDLHELALAEARELRLAVSEVALSPVIESAARASGLEGDARLNLEFEPALTVRADAVRLRQVVLNLLSNAARYTPADGVITVRTFQCGEATVEVHNTGSALSAEELPHVFDRFYRTDASRQRATGGSGLGLTIVKNLVEAQGGRVWARSDTTGVTFAFALPVVSRT